MACIIIVDPVNAVEATFFTRVSSIGTAGTYVDPLSRIEISPYEKLSNR
jgi:hypothetical protein